MDIEQTQSNQDQDLSGLTPMDVDPEPELPLDPEPELPPVEIPPNL